MQLAGLEGQQVVLLLEDYQFVHTAFLEMVNSLLSSGLYCVCVFVFPCLHFTRTNLTVLTSSYILLLRLSLEFG